MRFGEGEIEAFLTIGHATVDLDGRGLVHISGESDETAANSNGAGKSSVADAVSWCFWGETARGLGGDEVVNTTLGKGCRVRWPIYDGNDVYEIVRHRKYPKMKNALQVFANGVDISKGTTPESQKLIEKILGCSADVFNAAVYSGQEQMPDLPGMTDKHLKLLVEEASGVDVLARAYETARARARDVAAKRADTQVALDRVTDRHASSLDQITRQTAERDSWNANQGSRITTFRAAAVQAATDAATEKGNLDPKEIEGIEKAIADIDTAIAAVASERDRERELLDEADKVRDAGAQVNRKLAAAEANLAASERGLTNAQSSLTATKNGIGKPCQSCTRPLEKEHLAAAIERAQTVVDTFDKDVADGKLGVNGLRAKVPAVAKLQAAADKALADHRASMTDISMETSRRTALSRDLSLAQAKVREVERMVQVAHQKNDEFKRVAAETNPYDAMLVTLDADLKKWAEQIKLGVAALKVCDVDCDYADAVVEVYAPAGVRAHRLDEATPYLNERTAHYLGSLTDGMIEAYWTTLTPSKNGKDLQEKFSIAVEKAGSAPTFKALSGGEKRKVRLACFLALQDLVATRASKSIELFIGDEVDDALDAAGLERLMGILEEKARDRGTVLIISHNDIGAYCRNTIIVSKKNGISTVRTA